MQIVPVHQSALNLAGYMAARGCLALSRGEPPGVDFGRVRADGALQVEAAAAHYPGALERARELLALPAGEGVVAQVVVHAARAELPGSDFEDALFAECRDVEGRLAGLVLAVPYRPARAGEPLAMHPARVVTCPEAMAPLADELLQAFAQGLASLEPGFSAWMQALACDDTEPPRPPPRVPDPAAYACSIHASDPQADADAKAAAHLEAFFAGGRFEGGLGFEKLLRGLPLDFSLASLASVDALLDRLHAERRPRPDAFLGARAGLNFLHLVAIYLGETLARAAGATIAWRTHAQLESVEPGRLAAEDDAATALVCLFNGHGPGTGLVFLPLDVVTCRLFGQAGAPTLAVAAAEALPAIRAARRADLPDIAAAWRAAPDAGALALPRPGWLAGDPLEAWFDALPVLARTGRVTWGRIVQANAALFRPGDQDLPAELVVDPVGRVDPDGLDAIADRLYALKGTRPRSPQLAYLAAYLAHERSRTQGHPLPASLGASGVFVSTAMFHRAHLPGGRLAALRLPVLVSDEVPGVVAVLPSPWWPEGLRRQWGGEAG